MDDEDEVSQEENHCPHCGGTGVFVSCGGTPEETESPCVCVMASDEYPDDRYDEDYQNM